MDQKKKTPRINVYLTHEDKKKLNELKEKYKLSYSTLARIITQRVGMFLILKIPEIQETYIYEETGQKTSIKPSNLKGYQIEIKNYSKTFTNCIKIFLKKDLKNYVDQRTSNKVYNMIYEEMKNEYDPNWNGNEWQRRMPKLLKQNREYYRRILDNE